MTTNKANGKVSSLRWHHESLSWNAVDRTAMNGEHSIFYMLATASFVEITTELYARNLYDYYEGDGEIRDWLMNGWEPEEMQHGRALRRYVAAAWPDFDWEASYGSFFAEYRDCCKIEALGPTRALEMARRCVVETGTCSYYTMIRDLSPCPVLRELTNNIRTDEAGHYRHFHGYYKRYREAERPSRAKVAQALWSRIREIDGEDAFLAYKHVWLAMHPGQQFQPDSYRHFTRVIRALAVGHYPFRMAAHMMTQPLGFGPTIQHRSVATLAGTARFISRLTGTATLQ